MTKDYKFKIKYLALVLLIVLCAAFVSGCGGDNNDADAQTEEPADDNTGDNAGNDGEDPGNAGNDGQQPVVVPTSDEPDQQPIAEKSPVAITRIEPEHAKVPDEPFVTGDGATPEDDPEKDSDGDGIPDIHDHDPADQLFPVDKCQVEVNGIYKKELATELISEINRCRVYYGISEVTRNTSLLACADNRAKEQTYFIGHFRPNGAPFTSISPEGEVQGECIAVDYRDAEKMVEAWYSVNDTRMQLMNPEYTQVGVSIYDVDDTYYIAAEFSY